MTDTFLDTDTLIELRKKTSVMQRLDVAYLSFFLGLFGFLNIGRYELFQIITDARYVIFLYLCMVFIDVIIANIVFQEWLSSKSNSAKRTSAKIIVWIVSSQPLIHFLFISVIVVGYVSYYSGMADYSKRFRNMASIQNEIEAYISKNKKSPVLIEDITSKGMKLWLNELKGEKFEYKKTGKKDYKIIFAGDDFIINTEDDDVITHAQRLQDIINSSKNDESKKMCFGE